MKWEKKYQEKLVSYDEAAGEIQSNDRVWYGPSMSSPVEIIQAITRRYKELRNVTMGTAILLYPFDYLKTEYKGHLSHMAYFTGPVERAMRSQGNVDLCSYHFSQTDWQLPNHLKPRVGIFEVSTPDKNGNMSLGPAGATMIRTSLDKIETKILLVNKKAPYVYGASDTFLNVKDNDVKYICECDRELPIFPQPPVEDIDRQIASRLIEHIQDGSTIQIGVGGVANAIGFCLENHKDLGVHTEMLTDSMMHLAKKGVITGRKKTLNPNEISIAFALGSTELMEYIHKNDFVKVYPTSYINDSDNIAKNHKFVSINASLMCDLTGQMCSESIGFDQFSATGGQVDFVRGATKAEDGKSFLVFRSTATLKDGTIVSRINATLPPGAVVTTLRSDVQYVATENGIAFLRGKAIRERVEALIGIAHPDFQQQLLDDAKKFGLLF